MPWRKNILIPPTELVFGGMRAKKTRRSRPRSPLQRSGANRSAIAGLSNEKWPSKARKLPVRVCRTRTAQKNYRDEKSNLINVPELRRSGCRDCVSARVDETSCTGAQNRG